MQRRSATKAGRAIICKIPSTGEPRNETPACPASQSSFPDRHQRGFHGRLSRSAQPPDEESGWQPDRLVRVSRQGRARRQYRQLLREHAAVQGAGSALPEIPRSRPGGGRLPGQRFRLAGTGQQQGDQGFLRADLRREISDGREDQRRAGESQSAFRATGKNDRRRARMEFPQIPGRARRQARLQLRRTQAAGKRRDREADRNPARRKAIRSKGKIGAAYWVLGAEKRKETVTRWGQ